MHCRHVQPYRWGGGGGRGTGAGSVLQESVRLPEKLDTECHLSGLAFDVLENFNSLFSSTYLLENRCSFPRKQTPKLGALNLVREASARLKEGNFDIHVQ